MRTALPANEERTYDLPTQWGVFRAVFSPAGLRALFFPPASLDVPAPKPHDAGHPSPVRRLHRELIAYLRGEPLSFATPTDLRGHTPFQLAVWNAMRAIPYGQTRSYGELARRLDNPGATRAVGNACGANPVPIIIPCHRVVAAAGLGGFSSGTDWKLRLLARETPLT